MKPFVSEHRWHIAALTAALAVIVLMILPYGIVQVFADPDREYIHTFSYFYIGVLGMSGNGFPFLAAVLASLSFLCGAAGLWRPRLFRLTVAARIAAAGFAAGVIGLLMCGRVNVWGVGISALQLLAVILLFLAGTRPLKNEYKDGD